MYKRQPIVRCPNFEFFFCKIVIASQNRVRCDGVVLCIIVIIPNEGAISAYTCHTWSRLLTYSKDWTWNRLGLETKRRGWLLSKPGFDPTTSRGRIRVQCRAFSTWPYLTAMNNSDAPHLGRNLQAARHGTYAAWHRRSVFTSGPRVSVSVVAKQLPLQ